MRAHPQKAAVEAPLLAQEDRVDRGRHVVIDPATARPAKQAEGVVVRGEHHLLGLARIGSHQEHPAVAQSDVGDLDRGRHPAEQSGCRIAAAGCSRMPNAPGSSTWARLAAMRRQGQLSRRARCYVETGARIRRVVQRKM
jgi:hypothetical protein